MPSAEVLLAQIAARVRGGTYDDELQNIVDGVNSITAAIKARRRVLNQVTAATLHRGDAVRLTGLRTSSGLNGVVAKVIQPKRTRVLVQIPENAPRHAGAEVTVPAVCLEVVD